MLKPKETKLIRFLKHNEIDHQKWNTLVKKADVSCVYAYTWFLDEVAKKYGAVVLNDYEALLPLPYKNRLGYKNIYQPFFSMYFSVIKQPGIEITATEMINAIPSEFRHVQLNIDTQEKLKGLHKDMVAETSVCQEIYLPDYEKTQKLFSGNTRRLIKKAEEKGALIKPLKNGTEVVNQFRSGKGKEIKEIKKEHYASLLRLMDKAIAGKTGFAMGAYDEHKELMGAGFFLTDKNRIIYLKGGSTEKGRKEGAMYLLLDHVMKMHKDKYDIFDFGGSKIPTIADFFHKLGGKDRHYYSILRDKKPLLVKLAKKIKS
jgi:hypothetical protein